MSLAESIEPDAPRFASAEAFLDWVEAQPEKWELVDGVAVMMAGRSLNHSRLAGNAYLALRAGLRGSRCEAFGSDAAVTLEPGRVGFPGVSVSCDAENGRSVPDPVVIIEVLSPTTQSYDLGDKARAYRKLASLRHLVFVRQDKIGLQHFYRAEGGGGVAADRDRPGGSGAAADRGGGGDRNARTLRAGDVRVKLAG